MNMFIQSKLAGTKTRPNRRKRTGKKNRSVQDKAPCSRTWNPANGSVTDGHNPHYGKRKKAGAKDKINLPSFTLWKILLTSFLIGICGLFYISHVFSTQQILQEVQQLENEYNRINRAYSEKRLEYDRLTGPKEIYQNAREQGFINADPADQVIILK